MIPRSHFDAIREKLNNSDKIIILYGPRQVGKTTLVKTILADLPGRKLEINADELKYIDVLSSRDFQKMRLLVEGYDLLFIDEAQRIPDIGINLKILHDALPHLKIIATGSSSFELANRTKEPLTGRTWTFSLFPVSMLELKTQHNPFELQDRLEQYLLFGTYPNLLGLGNQADKIQYLQELSSAYLYKDILEIGSVKHADKLRKLLQLLAFQAGQEVSLNELGNNLQISKDTVGTYIDLLEKAFVVFRLTGFSRNLRKEIVKKDKIFFWDCGIRNVLIDNFNQLTHRNDAGQLWENFLTVERLKKNAYQRTFVKSYFWRTYTGAELDYVEEGMGQLSGFEFKFSSKTAATPASWSETYPEASFQCINRDNFLDFLT
jgi:predicted AAA+ superfamily ATPase